MNVRPVVCDRSRAWISIRLDGEISHFESVLLRAHLRLCNDCRGFADDIAWQTSELRAAPLERPTAPVSIPRRAAWSRRSLEYGTAAAAACAAAIALVVGLGGSHAAPAKPVSPPLVSSAFTSESRGLPQVSAINRTSSVELAHGRRALPQL